MKTKFTAHWKGHGFLGPLGCQWDALKIVYAEEKVYR